MYFYWAANVQKITYWVLHLGGGRSSNARTPVFLPDQFQRNILMFVKPLNTDWWSILALKKRLLKRLSNVSSEIVSVEGLLSRSKQELDWKSVSILWICELWTQKSILRFWSTFWRVSDWQRLHFQQWSQIHCQQSSILLENYKKIH